METTKTRFKKLVPEDAQAKVKPFRRFFGKPLMYVAAHIEGFGAEKDNAMQKMNKETVKGLEKWFRVFLPQRDNPYGTLKGNSQGYEMALVDAEMIRKAKIIIAVGGFGKDTAWECGYATDKLQVLVLPDRGAVEYHANDWMLLLAFKYVLVPKGEKEALKAKPAAAPDLKILEFEGLDSACGEVIRIYEKESGGFLNKAIRWLTEKKVEVD